jgi:hypothetical protein
LNPCVSAAQNATFLLTGAFFGINVEKENASERRSFLSDIRAVFFEAGITDDKRFRDFLLEVQDWIPDDSIVEKNVSFARIVLGSAKRHGADLSKLYAMVDRLKIIEQNFVDQQKEKARFEGRATDKAFIGIFMFGIALLITTIFLTAHEKGWFQSEAGVDDPSADDPEKSSRQPKPSSNRGARGGGGAIGGFPSHKFIGEGEVEGGGGCIYETWDGTTVTCHKV